MPISARNKLRGKIEEIQLGDIMAHVVVRVGDNLIESAITRRGADELKLKGVTVNAVLPSIIDTPMNRRDMPKADFSRWVAPADLAAVMLFLASDEAKAVTGALIPVSGRV